MKRRWLYVLMLALAAAAVGLYAVGAKGRPEKKTSLRIGLLLYRGDDVFINTVKGSLEERAKEYEQETGVKVVLDIMDAKGSQLTQNDQAERLISLGCDALCVNMVDRSSASIIIDQAKEADVPVVFFNREPVEEDMERWEKLYYVGADAKESAILQGRIIADAYKKNPASIDRNMDGTVSYVLLEGETNHQDSLIRTEYSVQTLRENGVPLKKLAGGIANWERSQASAMMEQWLEQYPGQIELVICNNDDMALGALDAIQRGDGEENICLAGIDGTPAGVEAVRAGQLFGTVKMDIRAYSGAMFGIVESLVMGVPMEERAELTDGKYFWCPQESLTEENAGAGFPLEDGRW